MKNDCFGDRMKKYENVFSYRVIQNMPTIVRLDGICFHSFTKNFDKPFDSLFQDYMYRTALSLCQKIHNTKLAYIQSDEISILLIDYYRKETDQTFDGKINKIISHTASIATSEFIRNYISNNKWFLQEDIDLNLIDLPKFDSRVFQLPKEEVCNYFIWRQKDAERNSISMYARSIMSHKEMFQKSCKQLQEDLFMNGINWNDCPTKNKRGVCVIKKNENWNIDQEIPVFTQNRNYIDDIVFYNGDDNDS